MKIMFKVNDENIELCPPSDEEKLCNNLKGNNVYTHNLMKQLAEDKEIIVTLPITKMKRLISDTEEELVYESCQQSEVIEEDSANSTCATNDGCSENLWTDSQTRFLLDRYHSYMAKIGPMKKFKTKKLMWDQISKDLYIELNITKTALQIENRYKTVIRKKKNAVANNSKSGHSREEIEFESELNKISSLDDSVEPEVIRSSKRINVLKKTSIDIDSDDEKESACNKNVKKIKKSRKSPNVVKTLQSLHTIKEEAKEKRHKEKLDMIRELFGKKN